MTALAVLVGAADEVAATSGGSAKRAILAELLRHLDPREVEAAVGLLIGEPRQGRVGVGWGTVSSAAAAAAARPSAADQRPAALEVLDIDRALDELAAASGPGSNGRRAEVLGGLFDRASSRETDFLQRLFVGELRQGALGGVMADAVALAASVPAALVRRAVMLSGDVRVTARLALEDGRPGLEGVGLTLFRPVQPMLASTAEGVGDTIGDGREMSVEWKLDGARIQVHRRGELVRIYTRNLHEVTDRLPEVVEVVRSLPAEELVLDGEVLGLDGDRPEAFQATMSRFGRDGAGTAPDDGTVPVDGEVPGEAPRPAARGLRLRPFFFDVLRADGSDLLDLPLSQRLGALDEAAGPFAMPRVATADPAEAAAFFTATVAAGHEGIMVKDLASPYAAGRRGTAWRKLKPVLTYDLVVLAAEWGHGRRQGWLSNLHLGARDPVDGSFVMVGKTFKGMTDELLRWQTEELLSREVAREGGTVHVRPDLVVEIAIDGVQASRRYPGGVALRFARVKRYRSDKSAGAADTIEALRSLLG